MTPINFGLKGDTLTIYHPGQQNINISMVKNEFTINQFKGKSIFKNESIGYGEQFIYLRIPKDIKIGKEPNNLNYVEK